jgi:hypothetical protein
MLTPTFLWGLLLIAGAVFREAACVGQQQQSYERPDVFSSIAEMESLFAFEAKMNDLLASHAKMLQSQLEVIRKSVLQNSPISYALLTLTRHIFRY